MKSKSESTPEIVFEDDSLLAVVKPYGMIVNKSDTSRHEYTLQDWAIENIKYQTSETKNIRESDFMRRSGIVHRLDKETSGILLIAKNEKSFKELQRQFKAREVEKTYVALCHGELRGEGSVSVPVGRLPWNRMRFGVVPEGRSATTIFNPLEVYEDPDDKNKKLTLIEAYPKTGRTHQIRVHMQYLGFPIYSDILYAGRKMAVRDRKRLGRHFLHAQKISFTHPRNGKKITIPSKLPDDLSGFLNTLQKLNKT